MDNGSLYILLISAHGLVRGHDLELGRDADTGGQTTYVVELARALARHRDVEQVDLLTRLIDDPTVSEDYAQAEEPLAEGARILRVPFGPPQKYVRKESLWRHLDQMVDRSLQVLRAQARLPDVIHSHYGDAGYVGAQLSLLLGVPLVHTSHSLGRVKRARLLAAGRKAEALERRFSFTRRIAAEEEVLRHAALVVASTQQEAEEQYGLYEAHRPGRIAVIPPGTDTARFTPPGRSKPGFETSAIVDRFLSAPEKPLIVSVARPTVGKNLAGLMEAYATDPELQEMANLAILAGQRDDIRDLERGPRRILHDLLMDVDRYDLWGRVALPKRHAVEDVPEFFRLAVRRHGVYVNPALSELFGLALIEAAASGLPVVATRNGGPRDIVERCHDGLLVDFEDLSELAEAIKTVLSDRAQWRRWSRSGVAGVRRYYSWDAHAGRYLKRVRRLMQRDRKQRRRQLASGSQVRSPSLPLLERLFISDVDGTLTGDRESLGELVAWLQERRHEKILGLGIATGRTLESARRQLRRWGVPMPDVLITAVGTEIHYGPKSTPDAGWSNHLRHRWRRDALAETFAEIPGLHLQEARNQREFKLSYYVTADEPPSPEGLRRRMDERRLRARLVLSKQETLDVLPVRASKGHAIRYLAYKWGLPLGDLIVAGDSGNDLEMLSGDTLAIVVGNHSPELEALRGSESVYFADGRYAAGVLEGLRHYVSTGQAPAVPRPGGSS
ncbi:MAG: HAD-IIB family hydrolase [Thermoleophilia bacterium]|nr:HAD-IIB family hydrolase [Thermoleophilia bacterium]